ncbi:Methyltransferase, partial [Lachnellula hyalina]
LPPHPHPHPHPHPPITISETTHRLAILSSFSIPPGSRVLEIGCGQGDSTIVLASLVGPSGHIDAYDPGSPDYGSPFTLGQSQAFIKAGALGSRIDFHRTMPMPKSDTNENGDREYDYDFVVLSHCIYYFSSPAILPALLNNLPKCRILCVAEWSLHASTPSQLPHVLTALLLSLLESKRVVESTGNIRTVLSPAQISGMVRGTGVWVMENEGESSGSGGGGGELKVTGEGLKHAYWEIRDLMAKKERVLAGEGMRLLEAERTVVGAMFDAIEQGVQQLGGVEGGEVYGCVGRAV